MSITLLTFFLLEAISQVCTVLGQQLYRKAGDSLVLTPNKADIPANINAILWKNGKDKVAEWDKDFGMMDFYDIYKGRTELDQATGVLTINNLSIKDSGVYSVEFNSKVLEKTFTLSVIKPVPSPQIKSSCNSDKTLCTLTCDGDTTDAEPVTYYWKKGDSDFEELDKQLNVTKSNYSKPYICRLENPVSNATAVFDKELFSPGQQLYEKAGDSLVLTPNKADVPADIRSIFWKNDNDKVAEWDKDFGPMPDFYGIYRGRTELDRATGVLTINNLLIKDSGVYSVEFNSKVLEKTFTFSVIKPVPSPQITSFCNSDKTLCTLTCDGDTTDAEPVTYYWKKGDGDFEELDKQLTVTQPDFSKTSYTCRLENPVSFATDLLRPGSWWTNSRLLGVSFFVLAMVIVVLSALVHRGKTGVWFYQKESMPWEGDFWKKEKERGPKEPGETKRLPDALNTEL